jgi:hypothetical protein
MFIAAPSNAHTAETALLSAEMNTNLSLIRQKCIEANPEIGKERKLVLELIGGVEGDCVSLGDPVLETGFRIAGPKPWGGGSVKRQWTVFEHDIVEAMREPGSERLYPARRPIRLADVLLAMFEGDAEERADELIHGSVKVWNLRKDDLNEQSEETITFLAELLK